MSHDLLTWCGKIAYVCALYNLILATVFSINFFIHVYFFLIPRSNCLMRFFRYSSYFPRWKFNKTRNPKAALFGGKWAGTRSWPIGLMRPWGSCLLRDLLWTILSWQLLISGHPMSVSCCHTSSHSPVRTPPLVSTMIALPTCSGLVSALANLTVPMWSSSGVLLIPLESRYIIDIWHHCDCEWIIFCSSLSNERSNGCRWATRWTQRSWWSWLRSWTLQISQEG